MFMQVLFYPWIWLTHIKPKTNSKCIYSDTVFAHGNGPSLGSGECNCLNPAYQKQGNLVVNFICTLYKSKGQQKDLEKGFSEEQYYCSWFKKYVECYVSLNVSEVT